MEILKHLSFPNIYYIDTKKTLDGEARCGILVNDTPLEPDNAKSFYIY